MKTWSVAMKLEHRTIVTVSAETIEEAREKANDAEWDDDGLGGAELSDWEVRGEPKED
jgi:hypothetical protein